MRSVLVSNMQKLVDDSVRLDDRLEQDARACSFEMVADSILAGQRILAVDDCLASGGTLDAMHRLVTAQGGTIRKCVGVMELPDLHGREKAPPGAEIFALVQFPGQCFPGDCPMQRGVR